MAFGMNTIKPKKFPVECSNCVMIFSIKEGQEKNDRDEKILF